MLDDPLAPKFVGLPQLERADRVLVPYEALGINPWEMAFISAYEDLRPAVGSYLEVGYECKMTVTTAKGPLGHIRLIEGAGGPLSISISEDI